MEFNPTPFLCTVYVNCAPEAVCQPICLYLPSHLPDLDKISPSYLPCTKYVVLLGGTAPHIPILYHKQLHGVIPWQLMCAGKTEPCL